MKKKHILPSAMVISLFLLALFFVPINPGSENPYFNANLFERLILNKPVEKSGQIVMILGGDVMLGRTVMITSLDKNDPTYPFSQIADPTSSADLFFVNLENPLFEGCERDITGVSLVFCGDSQMVEGLSWAGVDVANLANNHTLNYGKEGLEKTKEVLAKVGIGFSGDGFSEVREVSGIKFGFVGFDKSQQVTPSLDDEERALISSSDHEVDVLIVSMHWGVEYQDSALPGVRALAHELVDLGADVIVGHHPHWVQDIESYNGVPIYYSLGNLIFDQMWSEKTREGLLVKLTFEDNKIVKEEFIKTYMEEWAQPKLVNFTPSS